MSKLDNDEYLYDLYIQDRIEHDIQMIYESNKHPYVKKDNNVIRKQSVWQNIFGFKDSRKNRNKRLFHR